MGYQRSFRLQRRQSICKPIFSFFNRSNESCSKIDNPFTQYTKLIILFSIRSTTLRAGRALESNTQLFQYPVKYVQYSVSAFGYCCTETKVSADCFLT